MKIPVHDGEERNNSPSCILDEYIFSDRYSIFFGSSSIVCFFVVPSLTSHRFITHDCLFLMASLLRSPDENRSPHVESRAISEAFLIEYELTQCDKECNARTQGEKLGDPQGE